MSRKMLVNATHPEENRVAIVEDGVLSVLDIEVAGHEQTKGNIYKAIVVRVESGLQAAFVDYGATRLGFLQIDDVHGSFFQAAEEKSESKSRPRINDLLQRGQEIIVQVVKEERGTKGAALTTYLSLAGRYMVLMPDSRTKTLSRKIEASSKRKKLKEDMDSFDLPEDMGYIVRTAALDQTSTELKRDCTYLMRIYEQILLSAKKLKAPALIYRESNLVLRSIREHFTLETDEVLVDDPKVFQEAKDFFQEIMPEYAQLVKLHQERRPIFSRYQIEAQIEAISTNRVPLPSGGSLVIDQTEALVAIDVNSGKMVGEHGVEATALRTNLEAAQEAARQLRLRDLGGLIVIDFIDMRENKNNRAVEKELKQTLKTDKAKITVGKISQFGLLEMSRQRMKQTLIEATLLTCPHCNGSGSVKSVETRGVGLLRQIHAGIAKGQIGRVVVEAPLDVVSYLLNAKRGELTELENKHEVEIQILGRTDYFEGQNDIQFLKRQKEEKAVVPPEADSPADNIVETPPVATAVPGGEDVVKSKRPRRRRGGKGAKTTAEEPLAAPHEPVTAPESTLSETDTPATPTDEGEQTEQQPPTRRRRPRRRKTSAQKAAETLTVPSATDQENGDQKTTVVQTDPAEEPADAEEIKKPRRRRTTKKSTPPVDHVSALDGSGEKTIAQNQPAAEEKNSSPTEAENNIQVPAAKRKTTRRSSALKVETAELTPPQGDPPSQEKLAETVKPATEEKLPAKRSRTRPADAAQLSVNDDLPQAAAKVKQTRRKNASTAAPEENRTHDETAVKDAVTDTAPVQKRRGRPKKKPDVETAPD
ncbi:MAG: Rne/Rng family ribonuclease [Desulfuromonadales bacterium]|nr:Rne/Rng family ribonuclease [Desulfuromonadales bacterium]MDT8422731.1 Rne/Rng family ribonuclease [Desulfuromonadales bacterium]